ncbi:MAG: DUF5706 domain-containing protein [Bacteroidia bacterium]|nr:DUF5706 domain-containing protein [Bacteroidia bacterium]
MGEFMEAINTKILAATEAFSRDILVNQLHQDYDYHNLAHTVKVVDAVEEIGRHSKLTAKEIETLKIAAWFHDLGYIKAYIGHEEHSMEMAREFLSTQNIKETRIERILELIEATKLDFEPRNTMEGVMKDADLYNLADEDAISKSQGIRKEWKVFCNRDFSDEEWDKFNYDFFREHEYYSDFGKEFLAAKKKENIRKLKKALKKSTASTESNEAEIAIQNYQLEEAQAKIDKLKRKIKKLDRQRPERGVETMFRTTYRTHVSLSAIADNKANILLSINAIIISIIMTKAFEPNILRDAKFLEVPLFVILLVCMSTIIFAILATRPKINSGIFSRDDILDKKTNLLFFGNFHNMDLDDYQWGIDQMMDDAKYLYGSMSKDIYFLGRVLAKKFQLLRIAYNVFMYGMAGALTIFAVSYWLGEKGLL